MLKLTTPISHIFMNEMSAKEIILLSDSLECREWCLQTHFPKQELLHFDINIIHHWNSELKRFIYQAVLSKELLEMVTFHMASCFDEPLLIDGMYHPGGKEYSRDELLEHARSNIEWLRSFLTTGIAIGVENTNYYPTAAYRFITEGDFITAVVKENDINFLFDIAHSKITAHNKSIDYQEYLATLPVHYMIQVHISGYGINANNIAFDAHNLPEKATCEEIQAMIEKYPIRYLTIEFYRNLDGIIRELMQYKQLKDEFNAT